MEDLSDHFEARINELLTAVNTTEFLRKKQWYLGLLHLNKELLTMLAEGKKSKSYYKVGGKYFNTVQDLAGYLDISQGQAARFVKQRKTDSGDIVNIVTLPTGVTFNEFYK